MTTREREREVTSAPTSSSSTNVKVNGEEEVVAVAVAQQHDEEVVAEAPDHPFTEEERDTKAKAKAKGGSMATPVAAAAAVAGLFVVKKLFGGRKERLERGVVTKEVDQYGALVEVLDLKADAGELHAPPPMKPPVLTGRTFVIKDNIDVAGSPTQYGCPAWSSAKATKNAPCVDKLLKAGARGVGKAVLDELAYGIEGENPHHRSNGPKNPLNEDLVTGGSSSGSAVAVAGGLCDFALGTDTCGSVRAPAACCGVFGMKTTFGAISTEGVLPMAKSFDTVGWFARDAALLRQVGHVLLDDPSSSSSSSELLAPSKFLIAQDLIYSCKPAEYSQILADVAQLSASRLLGSVNVAQVKLENFLTKQVPELKVFKKDSSTSSREAAYSAGRRKLLFEAAQTFSAFFKKAEKRKIGKVAKNRVKLSLDFHAAVSKAKGSREGESQGISTECAVVETMGDTLNEALSREKVLIVPSMARLPLRKGAGKEEMAEWRDENFSILILASATGLPQVTMPLGELDDKDGKKIPVSLSLIGARGSDKLLLDTCHAMVEKVCQVAFQQAVKKQKSAGKGNGHVDQDKLMAASLKDQGNQAFREGRFYDAVQLYSQGIQLDDSLAVLYSNRAMALLKLGNFVDAESDCTTCLSLDPSNVKALLRRGTARAYLAQFQEALEDFEQVLVLEPNNAAAAQELERMKEAFSTPAAQNA